MKKFVNDQKQFTKKHERMYKRRDDGCAIVWTLENADDVPESFKKELKRGIHNYFVGWKQEMKRKLEMAKVKQSSDGSGDDESVF